ncbi:subtilisin-like protease SBT1.8 [Rhodamnia argentea]|uniref:Subtilisin-like protease SBT1.8 n=1 Tax=Rhodamnia argentea TaxID=178133 RepID=A0A8B8P7A8_9MYRT|nr:subtilisin-like protease SBT1.8 [Rhodamnia argentea]
MASSAAWLPFLPLFLLAFPCAMSKKTYIVQMREQNIPNTFSSSQDWYSASLQSLASGATDLLYVYTDAFNGYAASLEPDQAEALRSSDAVLGVYEDVMRHLHTTRTPGFLKVEDEFGLWPGTGNHSKEADQPFHDVIIGLLDTGVWPEAKSFDDSGFLEVPARWKGECMSGPDFDPSLCNKKLIGAYFFSKGYIKALDGNMTEVLTPRDHLGHGTHTSSTAAGSPVANASLLGHAGGVAQGMAPHARVASYKVCWEQGCTDSDILAAMDQAIRDGVDVLSISLGGADWSYYETGIAIGGFSAMEKGIFVSASAGNEGPQPGTLSNGAPWIMTVGASTLDRTFPAYALLGNKMRFTGASLYGGPGMGNKLVGLVYNTGTTSRKSNLCMPGSLDPSVVRGKVVVCERGENSQVEKGGVVRDAGGVGMILVNTAENGGEELLAKRHLIPTAQVGAKAGNAIREYAKTDRNPMALVITGTQEFNVRPTPVVAAFSSRGPYNLSVQILKPDVIGPGVNILAAWPDDVIPAKLDIHKRSANFNIISGTSMSCPHISGVAALLKAAHPNWSTSAIKSALMTTAYVHDNARNPITDSANGGPSSPWTHGAGHIDPRKALSPGLVYDLAADDYIAFVCSLNYTVKQVQSVVRRTNVTCSTKLSDPGQLNYPSFSVVFGPKKKVVRYTREVTNVGDAGSVYRVAVEAPSAVTVRVRPRRLVFGKVGEKKRYGVTFVARHKTDAAHGGSITWRNRQHRVRSPVAFLWGES